MIFHDFSMVFGALQWRYVHFWRFVFPKKRLAWIRTHARLRPSFSGLETVVVTTSPRPRLRVKGVHIEVMCNRTTKSKKVYPAFSIGAMDVRPKFGRTFVLSAPLREALASSMLHADSSLTHFADPPHHGRCAAGRRGRLLAGTVVTSRW